MPGRNNRLAVIACTIMAGTLFVAWTAAQGRRTAAKYLGSKACKACHENALGDQYTKWKKGAHAKAYRALLEDSKRLQLVKAKFSISDPSSERKCLRCHATGGGRYPEFAREGVGCESCHGPSEKYISILGHASGANAYNTAIRNGMWPIIGINAISTREKMCMRCHAENRICNLKGPAGKNLPIQIIADIPFAHPLRK